MKKKRFLELSAWLLLTIIIIYSTLALIKRQQDRVERSTSIAIKNRVANSLHIGMPQDEARQNVQEAWRYYLCETDTSSVEIYVFGSRNLELAGILYLRFDQEGERLVLTQIAYIEYYKLPSYERRCEVRDK